MKKRVKDDDSGLHQLGSCWAVGVREPRELGTRQLLVVFDMFSKI